MTKYNTTVSVEVDGIKYGFSREGDPRDIDINYNVKVTLDRLEEEARARKERSLLPQICEWGHNERNCDCIEDTIRPLA